MMSKRTRTKDMTSQPDEKRTKKQSKTEDNGTNYLRFKIESSTTTIPTISINDINKREFQEGYVLKRKPCIIEGIIPDFKADLFRLDKLTENLDFDQPLQVEEKIDGGYGSGANRLNMTLGELIEKLKDGEDSLYLTTQYDEDEVANELQTHDSEEDEEGFAGIPSFEDADDNGSDLDSIDINNLVDDFEELQDSLDDSRDSSNNDEFDGEKGENNSNDEESLEDDSEVISNDCKGGVLTVEEGSQRLKELLQRPLTGLIKKDGILSLRPKLIDLLVPQQINLWMGRSSTNSELKFSKEKENLGLGRSVPTPGGTSSGLHHDHADNLYIPVAGRKRFTLFSPDQAENLYLIGSVNEIFNSGVIDYKRDETSPNWKHIRSDGAMVEEIARWRLENEKALSKAERKRLLKVIETESAVHAEFAKQGLVKRDPPSFSKIPPSLLHLDEVSDDKKLKLMKNLINDKFPKLLNAPNIKINLQPGQMLYLPAGWFHEVTSFGDEDKNGNKTHIAINYWYVPPNGDSIKKPYLDSYWEDDFIRTEKSLEYFQQN